jgi:hypothetical protein
MAESSISPPAAALTFAELGAAVRQIVAPLQESLDREVAERQALQVESGGLRDQLAAVQLAKAMASGENNTERARREAAEAKAKKRRPSSTSVGPVRQAAGRDQQAVASAPMVALLSSAPGPLPATCWSYARVLRRNSGSRRCRPGDLPV